MAVNPAQYYGTDIACINDADELFTEATGLQVVIQDVIHRITTTSVLGPGGDDWGYDLRNLLGATTKELARMQPTITEVIQRDDRIETADVTLTATTTNGLADIDVRIECTTALGPFTLTSPLSELTTLDLENLS
jgi:hypothetical protein